MGVSNIGLNFQVTNFPIERKYDLRINARDDFNHLRYSSSFGENSVGVSFLDSNPVNIQDNLIVEDLTDLVEANSPRRFVETEQFSQTFDLDFGEFLLTDVFKTTSNGETVPMYYRHDLSDIQNLADIEILDGNFEPVNADLYVYFDESVTLNRAAKFIYTNLQNSFSREQNEFTVYYVRYRDTGTGEIITKLLDANPFYLKADFSATGFDRVYTVEANPGDFSITIYFNSRFNSPTPMPNSQRFSIKSEGANRISVIKPIDIPASQRWYMRITRGEFYRSIPGDSLFYHMPEYFNQFFSPVAPFKTGVEKQGDVLDDRLISVKPSPIANLQVSGFYIYIALRDSNGSTIRAITNDPSSSRYITVDNKITDVFYEKDMIQSVDTRGGFIRLSEPVDTSLIPYITYKYQEEEFTYRNLSVNSTINPDILNKTLVYYIKPDLNLDLTRAVYHLVVDEDDIILEAEENSGFATYTGVATGGSTTEIQDIELGMTDYYTGYEVQILSGLNTGRRVPVSSFNSSSQTLFFNTPFLQPIEEGDRYRIIKKNNNYIYEDPITGNSFQYQGWKDAYTQAPHWYVLLANVFAIQTLAPRDISSFDIRLRGGGIKEQRLDEALELQDEVQWYWDVGYWDGQPYPGMGANIVEIPRKVLQEVGGQFTRGQVREVVQQHMAEGSYPVIRYYDQSTVILKLEIYSERVFLRWRDVDASSYNVYFGLNPDSLQLYRNVAGSQTELSIEGLENNRTYYFRVNSVVAGVEQLPSRIVFGTPFDPSTVKPGAVYGQTIYLEGSYQS